MKNVISPTPISMICRRAVVTTVVALAALVCCVAACQEVLNHLAVKPRYFEKIPATLPLEMRYTGRGGMNVASETFESGEKKFPNYKIWYPEELINSNRKYPVVIMANGTGVPYQKYEAVFEHLASWGFVVAGNDDEWSALGLSSSKLLDFTLSLKDDPNAKLRGKLDTTKIGIAGHSQGGVGAIHAVTDYPNGAKYVAVYTASATSLSMIDSWKIDKAWVYDVRKIKIPYIMVAATGDVDAKTIAPLASLEQNFNNVQSGKLTVMARRKGIDHGNTLDHADGYMTAWFRFMLMDDEHAKKVFTGGEPELHRNTVNWQDVKIKNSQQ